MAVTPVRIHTFPLILKTDLLAITSGSALHTEREEAGNCVEK